MIVHLNGGGVVLLPSNSNVEAKVQAMPDQAFPPSFQRGGARFQTGGLRLQNGGLRLRRTHNQLIMSDLKKGQVIA